MGEIRLDKEFRALIPPLADEERAQLEANILADGCRDPLVVWNGTLIDGHNRYEICTKHGKKFKTTEHKFASRDDAKVWIIDNQMGRRNLPDIDRIALQESKEGILRPKARANAGTRTDLSAKLPTGSSTVTRKECAKSAGVGERTYDAGKVVLAAAKRGEIPKETIDAIRRKEKSIHRVAKEIKETKQKEKRQAARAEAAAKVGVSRTTNIHVGDFRDLGHTVADGSLSLIFTDPPYDRNAINLFPSLAKFGREKLADGGSLLCYVGHVQLNGALDALSQELRHWWTLCCLHSGGQSLMREYGIRVGWKPVLWFVKGTRDNKEDIVQDVMSGGREKSHHDWQQAEAEAEYWIDHLCPKDGIVCDPFLGGGTTAAAAIKLNRRWVAFEKDHEQAVLAMARCRK